MALVAVLAVACSSRPLPTVVPIEPTHEPSSVALVPTPTPEPSLDPNGVPPTTTTGWWGDPDNTDGCRMVGHFRIGYRVAQIGDCLGVSVDGPPELTLDVGEDFDLHMTIPADGEPPIWPLPVAEDDIVADGWLIFDDATMTYRALSSGTTRLVSPAPCQGFGGKVVPPTNPCPILVIHVRPISTRCIGLAPDVCRAVGAAAVRMDWIIGPGQRIVGWVAQPDSFIGDSSCGTGIAKVTFQLEDPDVEATVQIGQRQPAASGPPRYLVCTY